MCGRFAALSLLFDGGRNMEATPGTTSGPVSARRPYPSSGDGASGDRFAGTALALLSVSLLVS